MNQAIFDRLLINDWKDIVGRLAGPFDLLVEASRPVEATAGPKATRPDRRASRSG
jgi:hypothetical protein